MTDSFRIAFRIGPIPVQILPSFFLMTFLLNLGLSQVSELIAWALVVLVSVLAHELGHAAAARAFGLAPRIQLHGMGGTTSWTPGQPLPVPKRIAVSLAGPFAGFAVAAIVRYAIPQSAWHGELGALVYADLLFVNFGWGILNLLPMLPLDGGNVMAELMNVFTHGRGERPARIFSIAVAGLAALLSLRIGWWWPCLLAASFAVTNWQRLSFLKDAEADAPLRKELERAYTELEAEHGARVVAVAQPVAERARTPGVKAEALQLLAFGHLLENRVAEADAAIAALPKGFAPHPRLLELRRKAA
jgi:Zn-dependent protease